MNILQANTTKPNTARIAKIEKVGFEDVYNMEVEDNHNFSVNGGMIVHNCMDDTRYFVKTKRIAVHKSLYRPIIY